MLALSNLVALPSSPHRRFIKNRFNRVAQCNGSSSSSNVHGIDSKTIRNSNDNNNKKEEKEKKRRNQCTFPLEDIIHRIKNNNEVTCLTLDMGCLHKYHNEEEEERDDTGLFASCSSHHRCCSDFRYHVRILCDTLRRQAKVMSNGLNINKHGKYHVALIHTVAVDSTFLNSLPGDLKYALFTALGKLPNLNKLDIFCIRNKELSIGLLSKAIQGHTLIDLGIFNANLVGSTFEFEYFYNQLRNNQQLRSIALFQIRFTTELSTEQQQQQLHSAVGLGPILKSLSFLPQLEVLKVIHFGTGTNTNTGIVNDPNNDNLQQQQQQQQQSLYYNIEQNEEDETTFQLLCTLKSMKRICLGGIVLNQTKIAVLSEVLALSSPCAQLSCLNLSCCSIGDTGCFQLCNALLTNTNLRELNLAHNHLSSDSAIAIRNVLLVNTTLKVLNLSNNASIGNEGCCMISTAFAPPRGEQNHYHHHRSKKHDGGSKSLSSSSSSLNSQLEELHLSRCSISEQGYTSIIDNILRTNRSALRKLYLKFNYLISLDVFQSLVHAVELNCIIQDIILDDYPPRNCCTVSSSDIDKIDNNEKEEEELLFLYDYYYKKMNFFLDCNKNVPSRKIILQNDHISKEQWIQCILSIRYDINKLYYYIQSKPQIIAPE